MFEWRKRTTCRCGERIQFVRTGPHRFVVLDAEPHPCGIVRLWQRKDGWVAHRMTWDEWARHAGPVYIEHALTCRAGSQSRISP